MISLSGSIPYEVIREILRYVPDIDVRRAFKVSNKLNSKEHEHLNYVIRRPDKTAPSPYWALTPGPVYYQRYCFMTRLDAREPGDRGDEFIDLVVHLTDTEVRYYFYMFRLLHSGKRCIHYYYSLT